MQWTLIVIAATDCGFFSLVHAQSMSRTSTRLQRRLWWMQSMISAQIAAAKLGVSQLSCNIVVAVDLGIT